MELRKDLKFGSLVLLLDLLKIVQNKYFDGLVIVIRSFPIHILLGSHKSTVAVKKILSFQTAHTVDWEIFAVKLNIRCVIFRE